MSDVKNPGLETYSMEKLTMLIKHGTLIALLLVLGLALAPAGCGWGESGGPNESAGETHDHDHGGEAEGEDVDDHEGHDHAGESDNGGLRLTAEQREQFGIQTRKAGPGHLYTALSLPGEIVFNEDRVVHVAPLVAGIVRQVNKSVGDRVTAGEIMAVIASRELAEAKAEYLAAIAWEDLARATFDREKPLFEKKISSEQDYLDAQQALAEASIGLRTAEQKLHALGLTSEYLAGLQSERDANITRYEIRAPVAGTVTAKHIALGESLESSTEIFTVADLSSVWINLTVYLKALEAVQVGQEVELKIDHSGVEGRGTVSMITPFTDEATRSATARIVLANEDGRWRPGTFVTGRIKFSELNVPIVVPRVAVQVVEGNSVVFVAEDGAFRMVTVETGRSDLEQVEIVGGLASGTAYVTEGAFNLKATMITSNLDAHAGHGH